MILSLHASDSLSLLRLKLRLADIRYALDHDEGMDRGRLYAALRQIWRRQK